MRLLPFAIVLLVLGLQLTPGSRAQTQDETRFAAVEVFVDAGASNLHAWQVKLVDPSGRAKLVGVEGGEGDAWSKPAYYDPKALHEAGEVILAAYSLDGGPAGKQRVARLQFAIDGAADVDFRWTLEAAADLEGPIADALVEVTR